MKHGNPGQGDGIREPVSFTQNDYSSAKHIPYLWYLRKKAGLTIMLDLLYDEKGPEP